MTAHGKSNESTPILYDRKMKISVRSSEVSQAEGYDYHQNEYLECNPNELADIFHVVRASPFPLAKMASYRTWTSPRTTL